MQEEEHERERGGEGEKAKRRREHIYVGPNWIMIFVIGEELLWQAAHKETACLSKVKSSGWDMDNPPPIKKVKSISSVAEIRGR